MPLYEYLCDACGHRFEVIQKFSDPLIEKCPTCGGPVHKLMSSPAIQFKGSGFYITDYAKKEHTAAANADKESSGSKDATAPQDTKETKDSKGGTDAKESKSDKSTTPEKSASTPASSPASSTTSSPSKDTSASKDRT
jgi:putative FmdB family regulatory protein